MKRVSRSSPVPRVVLAHPASSGMLGQREYETRLIEALQAVPSIEVTPLAIQPLRARDRGRRVPMGLLGARSAATQRMVSRAIYGHPALVHRLDAHLPAAANEILTLHDVAPLRFDDEGAWPRAASDSARRARVVLTPSEFSAAEVRTLLGIQHVLAIPNGVDPACRTAGPLTPSDRSALAPFPERFVLWAGGSSDRKNPEGLARAWQQVLTRSQDDTELVVCGPPSAEKDRLFGQLPRCRVLGFADRATLLRLMTSAAAVVVPSLYEGFGLPVLEAMAAGTVVVSARTSSLIEVSGEAGILVEPSPEGIAEGLLVALDGTHERRIEEGRRWASTFTWEAAAERHAEVYRSAIAAQGRPPV